MSDNINHPAHYSGIDVTIECIDLTRHLNFQLGNAVKYLWRAGRKGDKSKEIEDLKKAIWYLRDYNTRPVEFNRAPAQAVLALLTSKDNKYEYAVIRLIVNGYIDNAICAIDRRITCNSPS